MPKTASGIATPGGLRKSRTADSSLALTARGCGRLGMTKSNDLTPSAERVAVQIPRSFQKIHVYETETHITLSETMP